MLNKSNRKPNKIWIDKVSQFYNRSMKWFLQNNDIEMYSTHNGGKCIIAECFNRTLKNNSCKCMTSTSKSKHIDKLDDIVNKYNTTYHKTFKMNPVDVKPVIYIDFNKENNKEGPKFKVDDHVTISKYTNVFAKGYVPNWCEEFFVITKGKNNAVLNAKWKGYGSSFNSYIDQKRHTINKWINFKTEILKC